jgi:hypothetical protein
LKLSTILEIRNANDNKKSCLVRSSIAAAPTQHVASSHRISAAAFAAYRRVTTTDREYLTSTVDDVDDVEMIADPGDADQVTVLVVVGSNDDDGDVDGDNERMSRLAMKEDVCVDADETAVEELHELHEYYDVDE